LLTSFVDGLACGYDAGGGWTGGVSNLRSQLGVKIILSVTSAVIDHQMMREFSKKDESNDILKGLFVKRKLDYIGSNCFAGI
jgi:hypothetical protein